MKRASYRNAVALIAANDDPGRFDLEAIRGYITVALVADIFGVSTERVARDVQRWREDYARGEREGCAAR